MDLRYYIMEERITHFPRRAEIYGDRKVSSQMIYDQYFVYLNMVQNRWC